MLLMATLDMIFVGMCAVTMDAPIDCSKRKSVGDYNTSKFDVLLVQDEHHNPVLYIRGDGFDADRLKCGNETGVGCIESCYDQARKRWDLPRETCKGSSLNWAKWDLGGTTVTLSQSLFQVPEFRQGHRYVGGSCWAGTTTLDGCDLTDLQCDNDVSWMMEIAKTGRSNGKVMADLSPTAPSPTAPRGGGNISAMFADLNGDLFTMNVSERVWHWTGVDDDGVLCPPGEINYEQQFASQVVFKNIKASKLTLTTPALTRVIVLEGRSFAIVENLPPPGHVPEPEHYLDSHGNPRFGCVARHFRHYYGLLDQGNMSDVLASKACYPVPATKALGPQEDAVCIESGYGGITDPFCAPSGINRGGGGN